MKENEINKTDESKLKSKEIEKLFDEFENSKNKTDAGVEYWLARDLQKLLNYSEWRKFNNLIEKAKTACQNAGVRVEDHFVLKDKMVELGSGSEREIEDYALDRYACYLISMNGSSSKEKISFAQTYFAIQTRKLEIIQERLKEQERLEAREKLKISETELGKIVYERGFKGSDFGIMRNKGDEALFGFSTKELQFEIPTIIPIPKEYMEISTTKGEPKLKQVIRNLKSNTKNKTSLVTQGYATLIKNGFQITPKGIEFVEKYFKQYL